MTTKIYELGSQEELFSHCTKRPSGCWEWKHSTLDGYGQVRIGQRTMAAHRYSFQISRRRPVPNKALVCHTCDNRKCIRPSHLFLGTHKDNSDDKIAKGRDYDRNGANNSNAQLTWRQVLEIREIGTKQTYAKTSKMYGVTPEMISLIVRGKAWKNV